MNGLKVKENIENMIYEVRGHHVMIDSDLAKLYGYTTKRINENVKNDFSRFSDTTIMKLESDEFNILRPKSSTANEISATPKNTH